MKVSYRYFLLLTVLISSLSVKAQNSTPSNDGKSNYQAESGWMSDFLMGPYLFIEHIPYDAVMLYGTRLGKRQSPNVSYVLEYVIGQQEDEKNTLGLTHHVSVHAIYYLKAPSSTFRPYAYAGGGFLEFKSFSQDEYNMAYYGGIGFEISMQEKLHSFIEPRYLNIAPFSFDAQNEIGVFWGLRLLY